MIRIMRRLRADSRGVTMAEICVALMIMSLGMVSILALFPKALSTTRTIMDLTTGSMVARSAMATLVYRAECNANHTPVPTDPAGTGTWTSGYGSAEGANVWPTAPPSGTDLAGRITAIAATTVTVSSTAGENISTGSLSPVLTANRYFMLVTSGRGRGMLYLISTGTNTSLTIGVNATDKGVEVGDWFEIIGPNCVGPVSAIAETDPPLTLYSWIAIVGGGPTGTTGAHRTFIFVYGRDASDDISSTFANIKNYKPAYQFATVLAKQG